VQSEIKPGLNGYLLLPENISGPKIIHLQ